MRTLSELAQEVLDVQNACNLSGVVHSWSRAITNLRELMPTAGTDAINRHPINKLWADKVAQLTNTKYIDYDTVPEAYKIVGEMAKSKSSPVEDVPASRQSWHRYCSCEIPWTGMNPVCPTCHNPKNKALLEPKVEVPK